MGKAVIPSFMGTKTNKIKVYFIYIMAITLVKITIPLATFMDF
jgi:hypothetical protein